MKNWVWNFFLWLTVVGPSFAADERPEESVDVGAVLSEYAEAKGAEDRLAALKKLRPVLIEGSLPNEERLEVAEVCVSLMQSDDNELANYASDLMSWMGVEILPLVIEVLKSDDPNGWARASSVVSSIASREEDLSKLDPAIPHLAKLLESEEKADMHNAFYAMSNLGLKAQPHLMKQLGKDDYYVRVMLKWFLKYGRESLKPLCGKLEDGSLAERRAALKILYHLSWETPDLQPLLVEEALGLLKKAVADEDLIIRSQAVDTLARFEKEAEPALDALVAALEKPDAPVYGIASAVLKIGPRKSDVDAFLEAAGDFKSGSFKEVGRRCLP